MADLLYGPDGPGEHDLRLVGDVAGKRVMELGCGDGTNAVALAQLGAVVIAVDSSAARLARARRLADEHEVRVEFRAGDLADLAFMRADSVDVVFSAYAVDTVEDSPRVFRQAQRVLKPNTPFVFSHAHPFAACVSEGRLVHSYLDPVPVAVTRWDETVTVYPRTLSDEYTDLVRAGFRVDAFVEPRLGGGTDLPSMVVWRARKEGT
ncbi:MAG TPA: class I SAM-dependent methyltransferase [Acidimicrobiia bacterium]|nr:class I SAM-dependent methyltransferase [Acidimicrobiia bacterium]